MGVALVVAVATLLASVGTCLAMPDPSSCCGERAGASVRGMPCDLSAAASCCEPAEAPALPGRIAPATLDLDAPLAGPNLLPSLSPPRLRVPSGPDPLPRASLLSRVSVLRL
jgi:hypothetical protein